MVSAADKHEEVDEGNWKTFLFDPENKTVLGRDAWSWFNLTIFYIGYYSLIAVISYYTITQYQNYMIVFPNAPNAHPRTNTRVATPGVGTFPGVSQMKIDSNRVATVSYIDSINNRLMEVAANEETKESLNTLGECSPVCADNADDCKFPPLRKSYAEGNPCIYYQINKVMLWKPYSYLSLNEEHVTPRNPVSGNSLIYEAVDNFEQDKVYFLCYDLDLQLGYTNSTDRVTMSYFSSDDNSDSAAEGSSYGYFNFDHWPIPQGADIKTKQNPFVAVKFNVNPTYHGNLINVACQAYAANLGPNADINEAYAETSITIEATGESTIAQINDEFNN